MINAKTFINELNKVGIEFYTGVPDSLMSEFSKSLHFDFDDKNHVIATNEGSALAMCMGYNLATNKIPLIYMQNSGLGMALASKHFSPMPMVAAPCALSAVMHCIIGSALAAIWKYEKVEIERTQKDEEP